MTKKAKSDTVVTITINGETSTVVWWKAWRVVLTTIANNKNKTITIEMETK